MARCVLGCMAVAAALLAGCPAYYKHYESSADREIDSILSSKRYEAVDRDQRAVKFPKPSPLAATDTVEKQAGPPKILSLREAIRIATEKNRDFETEREALKLSALAASLQRRNYGPILSNTIAYVYTNGPALKATGTASGSLGVSQIVPTGGTVGVTASGTAVDPREDGGPTTVTHDVTVSFEQPLLKGFGYEVAYEALTQAERDVIYALRDFELFREDFTIDVLRRYYGILRQKHITENSRHTFEQFTFLRKRSDALFEIGTVRAIDKFRAAQEELTASNEYISEQETLGALLDDFKVFLGLPVGSPIDVEDIKPDVKPANIDLKSALEAAIHNRLDLKTTAERFEDADRRVRNARNGLLPDLDLAATASLVGSRVGAGPTSYDGSSHSVSVALSLPLDKVPDRNAYKAALIDQQRKRRAYELATDSVKVQVLNTYRRLHRLANSVRIETENVTLAEKRVENAKVRFEAGELGNRDVVEAQSAKLQAQNSLIGAILDYEVARLQLKRDIGILFVDAEGMWKE